MKRIENPAPRVRVRRFRRRLARLLVVDRTLRFAAAAGFAWGAVALALRAGVGADPAWLGSGLAAVLAVAFAVAVVHGLREVPAESAVRALLDRHERRGGLLMADAETDLGSWRTRLGTAEPPRLRWRSGPAWTLLLGAALFVTASFLVPARTLEASSRPLAIGGEVDDLGDGLEALAEEGLLEEAEAERFEAQLEALAGEASGDDPARAWEALDHLRESAERTAGEAAEAAFAEGERLAAAAEVAAALDAGAGPPELEPQALEELTQLAARAARESRLLDETPAASLAAAARSGDLGQLRQALGESRAGLAAKLDRLHEAGLIDLETLMKARGATAADDAELADFLAANGLEAAASYCDLPGRGGVDRGRGDAEMTWRDPAAGDGAGFEEQVLDPASLAALEKSGLLGIRAVDPSSGGPPLPAAAAAVLDPAAAGGGGAHTRTVLPRHRGAVKRFFHRGEGG